MSKTTQTILGRYVTPTGPRVLLARTKKGETTITDEHGRPSETGKPDTHLVDIVPFRDGPDAVEAIASDYLEQARQYCAIPMTRTILDGPVKAAA